MIEEIQDAAASIKAAIAELRAANIAVPVALFHALGALNFAMKLKATVPAVNGQ